MWPLAALSVAVISLSGCQTEDVSGSTASAAPAMPMVQASRSHCGAGWTHAAAGLVQVQVRNTDVNAEEVYLADVDGKLYGEIDPLAPGATAVLRTRLSAGSYHVVCSVNDGTPVHGPEVSVSGAAAGVRGVRPVTSADLAPRVIAYQRWVEGRLTVLRGQAKTLSAALSSGDRGSARAAWRTANHTWNTMGGAYGAFGDLGDAIAGDPLGLPRGVQDPRWTGLLRIEYGLWHGQTPTALARASLRLERDLASLDRHLKRTQFQPLDIVRRTHEITEDTLQQTLTGHADYGAHVQLADALAQLDGTTELLTMLQPLLAPRYPGLPAVQRQIAKARTDIRGQHRWAPGAPDAAPDAGHELVDSDIAQLAELLAPVPTILEPRIT